MGKIETCSIIILIDTGSTHSFIDEKIAKRVKLPIESGQLTIQVANGDTLPYMDSCKTVLLKMQGCEVLANLFLLILGGCYVILGVDWLRNLGTI